MFRKNIKPKSGETEFQVFHFQQAMCVTSTGKRQTPNCITNNGLHSIHTWQTSMETMTLSNLKCDH